MSDYWFNDYVAHGKGRGRKKGFTLPNHKYLFRIKVGDDYQYFYTLAEWQNRFKKKVKGLVNKAKQLTNNQQEKKAPASAPTKSPKKKKSLADILDKPLKKVSNAAKKAVDRVMDKIEQKKADKRHETQRKKQGDEYKKLAEKSRMHEEQKKADARHESFRARSNNEFKQLATKAGKRFKEFQATHEPKDHKYLAKIKMPNGKFRYFYDQSELNSYYKKNPSQKVGNFPLKKETATPDQDMASVNPGYHVGGDWDHCGYTNNCYSCAITYDMRRRGYDVHSIYDENGGRPSEVEHMYKGGHFDNDMGGKHNDLSTLERNMSKKYGPNSRGVIAVYWKQGGGHAMAWELDSNSKLTIYDAQSNDKYSGDDAAALLSRTKTKGIYRQKKNLVTSIFPTHYEGIRTMRTDDKEPTDRMKNYVCVNQKQTESRRDPGVPWINYARKKHHHASY